MTRIFDEVGFVDVHRGLDPREEQYTWWSNRGQAWAKNVGWRIDYHVATPASPPRPPRSPSTKKRNSDHAPLTIEYGAL
jgi:exodeoxyribonuclease-3